MTLSRRWNQCHANNTYTTLSLHKILQIYTNSETKSLSNTNNYKLAVFSDWDLIKHYIDILKILSYN